MTDAVVIICTFPDQDSATRCADALVEAGLAACAQVQGKAPWTTPRSGTAR
jgi:uncharacterized protein involved in tolerance to divalent cations